VVWEGAEEPKPVDVIPYETDYVFGSGDVVRISIFELLQDGRDYTQDFVITETGKVSIPDVGLVEAAGLSESQLENEIQKILKPGILKEPSVAVTLLKSEKRMFSILGDGVPRPGRYNIPRYDFRLTDALATAGGIEQFNVSYVYVCRSISESQSFRASRDGEAEDSSETGGYERSKDSDKSILEIISPSVQVESKNLVITAAEMATQGELTEAAKPEGFKANSVPVESPPEFTESEKSLEKNRSSQKVAGEDSQIKWIFEDGKWVPRRAGERKETAGQEPASKGFESVPQLPEEFDWSETGEEENLLTRVIQIPADKLLGGNPRYNVMIRPGDSIHVPVDIIGEFYITGNVNNAGVVNLTGRPMTLKMAIASAGGLGPLAWPKKCEVIRRIGKNKEEIVLVDLDKIASGQQPDFFIKTNDLINVGTHPTSRWRAVLRNAFRATYGFGFIYDRNFADRHYGTTKPWTDWF